MEDKDGRGGALAALGVAAALVPYAVLAWRLQWVCDDAYIAGRYAQHLAAGDGLVFNVGEPVPVPRGSDPDVIADELRERLVVLLDETIARYPDKPAGAWWIPQRLGGSAPTPEEALQIEERVRQEKAERRAQENKSQEK